VFARKLGREFQLGDILPGRGGGALGELEEEGLTFILLREKAGGGGKKRGMSNTVET